MNTKKHNSKTTAVAVLTFEIPKDFEGDNGRVQIFPAGSFRAGDGRPYDAPHWYVDEAVANRLFSQANAKQNDYVIDYEHQTLNSELNGQPAPAAGWCKLLSFNTEDGLWAEDVKWTPKAKAFITNDEYRYISPVFRYDAKTGEVLELLHLALTNNPALDGMSDVGSWVQAKFSNTQPKEEESSMKLVLAALNLQAKPDATAEENEAAAVEAISALTAKADKSTELEGQITALKSQDPDPKKYVPIAQLTALRSENEELKKAQFDKDLDTVLGEAQAACKISKAQSDALRKQSWESAAALKEHLESYPVNAALKNQQQHNGDDNDDGSALSDAELAICRATGVSPEDFAKTKAAQSAQAE